MRPYSDINIGDIYEYPPPKLRAILGPTVKRYTVIGKADRLIEVKPESRDLEQPTYWMKPSEGIFIHRIFAADPTKPGKAQTLRCDICQSIAIALVHCPGIYSATAYQRRCRAHLDEVMAANPDCKVLEKYRKRKSSM